MKWQKLWLNIKHRKNKKKEKSIKVLGGQMKERLVALRKTLSDQQDTLSQSVADIEHAMIELHYRHAKQIVQIYVEMKHL